MSDALPVVVGTSPGRGWARVGRGLHRVDGSAPQAHLVAWSALLPEHACFTGLTALDVRGLWLPQIGGRAPVFAAITTADGRTRRPEIRTIRHGVPTPCTDIDGLRVATAAEALLVCARDVSLLDMVVLVDGALQLCAATIDEIVELARTQRWGARRLRQGVALSDGRSESPWESVLRLFHETLEVPVDPQFELRGATGEFVARGDLRVRGRPWLHEYDGAVHRDPATHRRDLVRERAVVAQSWVRRGFTSTDLTTRSRETMHELDRALGRPSDLRRLRAWRALFDPSTLTSTGRRLLADRWGCRE